MSTVSDCSVNVVTNTSSGQLQVNTGYDPSTDTMASAPTVEVHEVINTNGDITYEDVSGTDFEMTSAPGWYSAQPGGGLMVVNYVVNTTGMFRIRICWSYVTGGGVSGDPHVTTFDGDSFTL